MLTLAGLAVVSYKTFAEFFVILGTLAALLANVLALFPIILLDDRRPSPDALGKMWKRGFFADEPGEIPLLHITERYAQIPRAGMGGAGR